MAKAAAEDVAATDPQARVLTIPNALSAARLVGVPVFLWLVLGLRSQTGDWWAVGLLIAAAASDWLDGKIARAFNQESRLGQVLDPAADRLYIVATVVALAIRGIIPWWLLGLLAARELLADVAEPESSVRRVAALLAGELDWSEQRVTGEVERFLEEASGEGILGLG